MKTIIINNQKEIEQYKDEFGYRIDNNLQVNCSLNIIGQLNVKGYLSIQSGVYIRVGGCIRVGKYLQADKHIRYIRAGESIRAGEHIEVSGHLRAGESIRAGKHIEVGGHLRAGWSIKAGGYIRVGGYIFSFNFEVKCTKLITKTLPFERKFWAMMPPLAKWKDDILNNPNYWDDIRQLPSKEEARQICAWDGWHPLLKCQLEMFLGLKTEHIFDKE